MKAVKVSYPIAEDFLLALRLSESSGRYNYVNPQGFAGAYQFGEAALRMIGYKGGTPPEWLGKNGIDTLERFLGRPDIQDSAVVEYYRYLWASEFPLYNLQSYIGKTTWGVKVTAAALLAGSHLVGADQVDKFLRLGIEAVDPWGTSVVDYMTKFANYDVTSIVSPGKVYVQTYAGGWKTVALLAGESVTYSISANQVVVAR